MKKREVLLSASMGGWGKALNSLLRGILHFEGGLGRGRAVWVQILGYGATWGVLRTGGNRILTIQEFTNLKKRNRRQCTSFKKMASGQDLKQPIALK